MRKQNTALELALAYPYAAPDRSYALVGGEAVELERADIDPEGRVALLAYGSNAAPAVLAGKLARAPSPVPVVRTTLRDFDVVYSAHLSPYGAVPATLCRSPGTEARAFLAYLTPEQLRLISATEPNYELARFDRPSCTLEKGDAPEGLSVYVSRHGCLALEGSEVALVAVPAEHRSFPELTEEQVLERVRATLAPERSLDEFVLTAATDPELSRRWTAKLRADARPFA